MENLDMGHFDIEGVLALCIPIIAVVLGMSLAMQRSWLDYKKKKEVFELHHRERMAAIDKGLEVPALPVDLFSVSEMPRRCRDSLRSGLIWTLVGAAVTIALYLEDKEHWAWGLIAIAVGVANLLHYAITRRADKQSASTN
jgi:Domain of unknown function (DUF6249)